MTETTFDDKDNSQMQFFWGVDVKSGWNVVSSYAFTSEATRDAWLDKEYGKVQKALGSTGYRISFLPGLQVGDRCEVSGDGDTRYTIVGLVKYANHKYGFKLDTGCTEEVGKCREPRYT